MSRNPLSAGAMCEIQFYSLFSFNKICDVIKNTVHVSPAPTDTSDRKCAPAIIRANITHAVQINAIVYSSVTFVFNFGTTSAKRMIVKIIQASAACPDGNDLNVSSNGVPTIRYQGEKLAGLSKKL